MIVAGDGAAETIEANRFLWQQQQMGSELQECRPSSPLVGTPTSMKESQHLNSFPCISHAHDTLNRMYECEIGPLALLVISTWKMQSISLVNMHVLGGSLSI